tara:strand:+ start:2084 stop:2527 length:444 start_codon:yes stop_codon:yes gene_type:complete
MIHLFVSDVGAACFVEGGEDSLADLQAMVEGQIELAISPRGEDVYFNEEGSFHPEFYPNLVASYETRIALVGPAVFTRANENGKTTGLTKADIRRWKNLLEMTENEGVWYEDGENPWTMDVSPVSVDYVVDMMADVRAVKAELLTNT